MTDLFPRMDIDSHAQQRSQQYYASYLHVHSEIPQNSAAVDGGYNMSHGIPPQRIDQRRNDVAITENNHDRSIQNTQKSKLHDYPILEVLHPELTNNINKLSLTTENGETTNLYTQQRSPQSITSTSSHQMMTQMHSQPKLRTVASAPDAFLGPSATSHYQYPNVVNEQTSLAAVSVSEYYQKQKEYEMQRASMMQRHSGAMSADVYYHQRMQNTMPQTHSPQTHARSPHSAHSASPHSTSPISTYSQMNRAMRHSHSSQSYSYNPNHTPNGASMHTLNSPSGNTQPNMRKAANAEGSRSAPYQNYYTPQQWREYCLKYQQWQEYCYAHQMNAQNHMQNNNNHSNAQNNPKNSKNSKNMQYLIQTVKDRNKEINKMQAEINSLRKKVGTRELIAEENFFNYLARFHFNDECSKEKKASIFNDLFEQEISRKKYELKCAKSIRLQSAATNLRLETAVIELTDNISVLRDNLEQEKHRNYLAVMAKNGHLSYGSKYFNKYKNGKSMDYPPENIIIQNLIRTQIEFYFSDYNLKRDKRLLDQLCSDRVGFLKIDSVMNLSRVRQLSSHRNQVINALKHSKFLTLTGDYEWVGRPGFARPTEKQFPFRRTVFVFGLPLNSNEEYVTEMLSPFGKLSKVKFDHGPDTLDRLVAENMFDETRVYTYKERGIGTYNYSKEEMVGGSKEYKCVKCSKQKQCIEGFYESNSYANIVCLQCAAASAESNLEKCKQSAGSNRRMIELLCGKAPRNVSDTKTALAVFTSQRQASKCVYVRSRIAFKGCFTTHYHHYSKLKKEIALTLQPYADQLKEIPPRQVLRNVNFALNQQNVGEDEKQGIVMALNMNSKLLNDMSAFDVDICGEDSVDAFGTGIGGLSAGSDDHSELSGFAAKKGLGSVVSSLSDDERVHGVNQNKKQVVFANPLNVQQSLKKPLLSNKTTGSLTAPVKGNSGVYLMRPEWNAKNHNQKRPPTE